MTGGALSAENALRSLLEALTSPPYAPTQHLEREQALAKQFAEILHFTLSFDELKVPPCPPCGLRVPRCPHAHPRGTAADFLHGAKIQGLGGGHCCPQTTGLSPGMPRQPQPLTWPPLRR